MNHRNDREAHSSMLDESTSQFFLQKSLKSINAEKRERQREILDLITAIGIALFLGAAAYFEFFPS